MNTIVSEYPSVKLTCCGNRQTVGLSPEEEMALTVTGEFVKIFTCSACGQNQLLKFFRVGERTRISDRTNDYSNDSTF